MFFGVILSLHIIFVVTWFAGLFYLPRLFVYHTETVDSLSDERFKLMEKRLYFGILLPSSLLALVFGLWLVALNWSVYMQSVWFWIKLGLVIALFGYQGMAGKFRRQLADGTNAHTARFFRIFNEIPLLVLVAVVFLVVLKPF